MRNLYFLLFFFFLSSFSPLKSQIVRINEFSQGFNNSKEWVELVVSSSSPVNNTNCVLSTVNISGWILDDNNGSFSPINHYTGSGIAAGHMRFRNVPPWNNLPVGAIIVIYNAADKDIIPNFPADDPYDWVNNDCVYVLPSNHPSLEYCTTSPTTTTCTSFTDYSSCVYGTAGGWSTIGLANAGDAIQVRDPSFNLVQGVVYGKSVAVSGCMTTPDMVGNSLSPLLSNAPMNNLSASFIGSTEQDYFDRTKWLIQSYSLATPGVANDLNNKNFIDITLRGGCSCNRILPNDFKLSYTIIDNKFVKLFWLKNDKIYSVEKSEDLNDWTYLGTSTQNFFIDNLPKKTNFYRLKSSLGYYSDIIYVAIKNPKLEIHYYDINGREIKNFEFLPKNTIFVEVINGKSTKKINL